MMAIGRRIARRFSSLPPPAVLAIGWVIVIVFAFPGMMTQDSFDHLREVRDSSYTDSHPPALAALWSIVDYVVAGPFGMLVFQTTLFLVGIYLLFRRAFEPRAAAWIATGVFVFPPVALPMVVIWKDAPMAGFLAIGLAGLLAERKWQRIAGLIAIAGAIAVRYNAFAATLPLVVLVFEWPTVSQPATRLKRWFRRYALATVVWVAVAVAAFSFNAAITDQKMYPWHSTLAVFDIVGTLAFVDEDVPDRELEQMLTGTDLLVHTNIHAAMRQLYSPTDFIQIISLDKYPILWKLPINGYVPAPAAQRDAIGRAFWDTITRYPTAYVQHRLSVMAAVLWLSSGRPVGMVRSREFAFPDYVKSLGMGTGWSKLQLKMTRWMLKLSKRTPIFVPWIYAVISLLLVPFAWRHRDMLALLASGLVLESSLLPLAVSPDYRYSHWMITCTVIAAIVLARRRTRGRKLVGVVIDRTGLRPAPPAEP
jgi:uncharacterized membrane protein SirB2